MKRSFCFSFLMLSDTLGWLITLAGLILEKPACKVWRMHNEWTGSAAMCTGVRTRHGTQEQGHRQGTPPHTLLLPESPGSAPGP